MIQRRASAAGINTPIGKHTFRATGITAYLKNAGKLEHAQTIKLSLPVESPEMRGAKRQRLKTKRGLSLPRAALSVCFVASDSPVAAKT